MINKHLSPFGSEMQRRSAVVRGRIYVCSLFQQKANYRLVSL
jgi:hypothetical protein